MARTATTCTASYSGCLRRRSRPSPKGASSERVLRQKLLDTELRRRQRRPFFPLPDELAVGEQLRRLHRCPPRGKRRVLEVPMQTVTLTAGAGPAYPRPPAPGRPGGALSPPHPPPPDPRAPHSRSP